MSGMHSEKAGAYNPPHPIPQRPGGCRVRSQTVESNVASFTGRHEGGKNLLGKPKNSPFFPPSCEPNRTVFGTFDRFGSLPLESDEHGRASPLVSLVGAD